MPTVDTPRITLTGSMPAITVNVVTGTGGGGTSVHNQLTGRSADDAHPISAITGLQEALDESGGGAVDSVNGETGTVVLDAADVGAIATSARGNSNGVASLDGDGTVPDIQLPSSIARDSEIGTQISAHNTDGSAHSTRFAAKTDFPGTNNHVPVRDVSGAQGSIRYTSGTTGYTIAYRTEDGQIGVAAPTDDSHAVNRGHLNTELDSVGFGNWTDLGNLGATETISGAAGQLVRREGTLDQACTITVDLSDDEQVDLVLHQDATGGRQVTFAGVDVWVTKRPSLLSAPPSAVDRLKFEQVDGVTFGYWVTQPSSARTRRLRISGTTYHGPNVTNGIDTSLALSTGFPYFIPWWEEDELVFDRAEFYVNSASASGVLHVALYRAGQDGWPTSRIASLGTHTTVGTGFKTATWSGVIPAGLSWVRLDPSQNFTIGATNQSQNLVLENRAGQFWGQTHYSSIRAYDGTAPATAPSPLTPRAAAEAMPNIRFRAA